MSVPSLAASSPMPVVLLPPLSSLPSCFVGVDAAKAHLVIARSDELLPDGSCRTQTLANRERTMRSWLAQLPPGTALVVESTNTYHRLVCDLAHQAGLKVFLINPYWLRSHRQAKGQRAKTDRCDAQLLVSYGQQNYQELHP